MKEMLIFISNAFILHPFSRVRRVAQFCYLAVA
jgi:hypothetical protein